MAKNAYIHIPFCKSKCKYCSFVSYPDLGLKNIYLRALKEQIKKEYQKEKLNTLYIGGGTPSLLTIDEFNHLLELFCFEENPEITVEINPEGVDLKYLKKLRQTGINRLSIGAQTFDDNILKLIGRRHNSQNITDVANYASEAGFDNINLDFIYGLPAQSLQDFEKDLKKALNLNISHISLYGLKIDKGCSFYNEIPVPESDLDLQADMYLKSVDVLKAFGFEHYETSNFSHSGFNSRHNLNYWNNNNYYGFGCCASGYLKDVRYRCESDLKKYIKSPLSKEFEQKLTFREILEEAVFLGLRKTAGINIEDINKKFGIDFRDKYKTILDKYRKFFIKTKDGYALNTNGILISNEILAEFISD